MPIGVDSKGSKVFTKYQLLIQDTLTVHDPGHFVDKYVVEAPRVVLLEAVDHELHVVQVDVLYARARTVKDNCHLLVGLFPGEN